MAQKKILFILWRGDFGGSERHVLDLVKNISNRGFEPSICFLTFATDMKNVLTELEIPFFEVGMRSGVDILPLIKLKNFLSENHFDIIHEHSGNKFAIYAYKLFSRTSRTIFTIHNGEFPSEYRKVRLFLEKKKIKLFDKVLCVSKELSNAWQQETSREVIYSPNGIDLSRFEKIAPEFISPLVSVGRLIDTKRFPFLLKLISPVLKKTGRSFNLAGTGPNLPIVQSEIITEGLSNKVTLLGNVNDIPHLLSKSSVFVFASKVESCGIVAMEAAAAGIPVVAIRNVGLECVVVDGVTGILIDEAKAEEDFPKKLLLLLENHKLWEKMSQASKVRAVECFGLQRMLNKLVDHYKLILEKK